MVVLRRTAKFILVEVGVRKKCVTGVGFVVSKPTQGQMSLFLSLWIRMQSEKQANTWYASFQPWDESGYHMIYQ